MLTRLTRLLLAGFAAWGLFSLPAGASMDIEEIKTPAGLKVWFLEDHSAPLISVAFAFKGGSVYDPDGKEGLANLLSAMLTEGAGTLDSQAFAAALSDIGMRLSFDAGRDYFTGRYSALTEFQDQSADLFNTALTDPRFDASALERTLSQIKTRLSIDAKDPQWIAIRALRSVLYPDHVYARRQRGTELSLDTIEQADLMQFVKGRFALDNITIGVSGNMDASQVGAYVDRLFQGLAPKATTQNFAKAEINNPGTVVIEDWPTPQSFILAGQEGVSRDDPDYLVAYVINHMLGGSNLTTRLNQEIREKRGWTYGISSFFSLAELAPLVQIAFSTQNMHAGEAIEVMKDVWGSIAEEGVTEEELQAAKDFIIGNYALQRNSIRSTARYLQGLQLSGLGRDYPLIRADRIQAIKLEDMQRVAERVFNADTLRIIAVGQPEGLQGSDLKPLAAE